MLIISILCFLDITGTYLFFKSMEGKTLKKLVLYFYPHQISLIFRINTQFVQAIPYYSALFREYFLKQGYFERFFFFFAIYLYIIL